MKIIALVNNKGGVGKTTSAVNLAAGIAAGGPHVLLADLDAQGSASLSVENKFRTVRTIMVLLAYSSHAAKVSM
jgi:chromosome partitioning protein